MDLGRYYNGSGQRLATEAFVSGNYATKAEAEQSGGVSGESLGQNGYISYKNGLTIQWGLAYPGSDRATVNFPTPFSSVCYVVLLTQRRFAGGDSDYNIGVPSASRTGFTLGSSSGERASGIYWVAYGR